MLPNWVSQTSFWKANQNQICFSITMFTINFILSLLPSVNVCNVPSPTQFSAHKTRFVESPQENCSKTKGISETNKQKPGSPHRWLHQQYVSCFKEATWNCTHLSQYKQNTLWRVSFAAPDLMISPDNYKMAGRLPCQIKLTSSDFVFVSHFHLKQNLE